MSTNHPQNSFNIENPLEHRHPEVEATITSNRASFETIASTPPSHRSLVDETESTTISTLVNKVLAKAVEKKATEIQIEPEENFLSIRYGHGETFKPLIDPLPKKFTPAILSRLKSMAELEVNECQTPQKGRIRKRGGGRTIDFFVQTQPSFYGEKVIIRVLDSAIKPPSLDKLIGDSQMRHSLEEMLKGSSGLLLVSRSQKKAPTPLLYSLLCAEDSNLKAMATVQESISYLLPEMKQIEVDLDGDEQYADVLSSLAQQDKSTIMVDDLCDPSIARMVAEMADNNHFIITSVSADDSLGAIALLKEMITPNLLAKTLIGVIHEHHLPRLCPTCRTIYEPSMKELVRLGIPPEKSRELTFYQPRVLNETEIEQMRDKGRLCRQCNGEGYHGRVKVYELLQITPSLKTAIAENVGLAELKQAAFGEENSPLLTTALELVEQGEIGFNDLLKLYPDTFEKSIPPETNSEVFININEDDLSERLEKVETLLMSLTQEFNELKKALHPTQNVAPPQKHIKEPLLNQRFSSKQVKEAIPSNIDMFKETIAADASLYEELYEELQDPGEWEALKRELDPNKETIIADLDSDQNSNGNPFRSIPDPW
ncbi:MAG: ATPase, T2SS/T4P/T4SS family [Crocosphaera sp.]|nr:ATPase, T2SS/T4P/T4SS family [Crocosphaera sp.]